MTILLADLVTRLTADVPARSGVPTSDQYTQAVKDAVADLGRRASVVRWTTLSVVAGIASYTLPIDFLKLIRLGHVGAQTGDVLVTSGGLVTMAGTVRETYGVIGDQLTIFPTPTATADRTLVYAASDALDSGSYATLSEERASIALLLASAFCLERIIASGSAEAMRVTTALGEEVDTRQRATALRTNADTLRQQYLDAVAQLNTGVGGLW